MDSLLAVSLDPVVVTVTRTPTAAGRLGASVSLVTISQFRREPPRSPFEVLRDVPGAYLDEGAGPGGPAIVRLRGGEEVHTQILVDGIAVNQSGGFFDMQGLSLSNLERVEVVRGPQSAAWGSSAVAGTVHFISPEGRPGPTRWTLLGEGGGASREGGSFRSEITVSGGTQVTRFSGGAGIGYDRGVFETPHDTWSGDAAIRIDHHLAERWSLTGTTRFLRYTGQLPVRDPGATRVPQDPNARNERDRLASALEVRFVPSNRWTHSLRAELYRDDFLFQDREDALDTSAYPFFVFNGDLDFTERLLRPRIEYQGSVQTAAGPGDDDLIVTYGGLWEHSDVDQSVSGGFGDSRLAFDRDSGAGFAEVLWSPVPRLHTVASLRAEKFEGIPVEMTPRLSLALRLLSGTARLRGVWGKAFKAPSLSQQYQENDFIASNPELTPERSESWEVGADLQLQGGRVQLGGTYFRQDYRDLIRTVGLEGTDRAINRNLGRSRAQGVEWTVLWRVSPRLSAGAEGSWVATEILENAGLNPEEYPVGAPLPFRPDVRASAFLEVLATSRLGAFLRASRVGNQTVLTERFSGRRVELESYVMVDVTATYRYGDRNSVYLRLENALGNEYAVAFDRPGLPVRASVGIRLGG